MSKFCPNCGAQIEEGAQFCKGCGTKLSENAQQQQQQQQQNQQQQQQNFQQNAANFLQNTKDETASMDPADIEKNKTMGGLAYFLFFLPLIACPDSKYGRFHANQGLLLLIVGAGLGILSSIFSAIVLAIAWWLLWWLPMLVNFVIWAAVLVIGIIGLINGFTGKAKELPLIGRFRIIK